MSRPVTAVFDVIHPFCGAISLFAVAYKLRDLRRDRGNLSLRGMCATRLFMALAYLCLTPAAYVRIDRLAGVANLCTLLGDGFIVAGALSSHLMVLGWFNSPEDTRRKARRISLAYSAALIALVALFVRAPLRGEHPVDFETRFGHLDTAGLYSILYLTTYGLNLINTARWTLPSSRTIQRPWLSSSLRLTAVGSLCVMGYVTGELVGLVGRWAGTDRFDMAAILFAPLLANLGSLVIVGGYTLPGWGRRIMGNLRQRRSFRRLYPMWFALYQATPDIALFEPRSARTPLFVRDVETHLYRLIIEIRDGQRSLRPYLDATAARSALRIAQQTALRRTEPEVTAEAFVLALGIRCKGRGAVGGTVTEHNASPPGVNLAAELFWLERVADAFNHIEQQEGLAAMMDRLAAVNAAATVRERNRGLIPP